MLFQFTRAAVLSRSPCYRDLNETGGYAYSEVFNELSEYDVYLLSRVVAVRSSRRWMGDITLAHNFGRDYRLDWWCEHVAGCKVQDVRFSLINVYLKYAFLSWLPNMPATGL